MSKAKKVELKKEESLEELKTKEKDFSKLITKVERNIDLISETSLIFDETYQSRKDSIKEMLEEMQSKYDLILIDTSSDTKYKILTKRLVELSSQVICLVQGNLIYLRNTMRLLKEYEEDRKKVKLVYNQKDKDTLPSSIMKLIFLKYKIIGNIHYHRKYNQMVNCNMKKRAISAEIRKEYKEIIKGCRW